MRDESQGVWTCVAFKRVCLNLPNGSASESGLRVGREGLLRSSPFLQVSRGWGGVGWA